MMNKLQQLIDLIKSKKESAEYIQTLYPFSQVSTVVNSLSEILTAAELLLSEQPGAITDDAHLSKHDVGGSADPGTSLGSGVYGASASGTAAVGGNEQTREHFYCLLADGYDGPRCNVPCQINRCVKMRLDAADGVT